jgi:hypothetical protein
MMLKLEFSTSRQFVGWLNYGHRTRICWRPALNIFRVNGLLDDGSAMNPDAVALWSRPLISFNWTAFRSA